MIDIIIPNFVQVTSAIKNLVNPDKVDNIARTAALMVESEAKKLCPVDTGRLRASITTEKIGKAAYAVGTNVEYAPYVEFGTRKMRAQPYLRPALERVKQLRLFRGLQFSDIRIGGLL